MNEEKRNIGGSVITSWERYKSNYDYKQNLELLLYYSKVLQTIDNQPTKKFRTTKYQDTHVEFFLEKFKFRRGFFLTIHVPSYLTNGHKTKRGTIVVKNPIDYFEQISQIVKKFHRRLERKCFTKSEMKNGSKRLEKLTVIEGCYNPSKTNHIHILVETPQHLSMEEMETLIRKSHGSKLKSSGIEQFVRNERGIDEKNHKGYLNLKGNFEMGELYLVPIEQYGSKQRLYTYLTKEVKENTNTVDWKNTYEKSLRYLTVKKEKHSRKRWEPNSRKVIHTGTSYIPLDRFMVKEKLPIGEDTSLLSRSVNSKHSSRNVETYVVNKSQ